MRRVVVIVAVLLLSTAAPLAAQRAPSTGPRILLTGAGNYLWSEGPNRGMTGTLGLGLTWRGLFAHVQAIDFGIVTPADYNTSYRWQFIDGRRECTVRGSGEIVDEVLCDGEWSVASAAELLYTFNVVLPVMVGGGYRFGDTSTPFGTVAVAFSEMDDTFLLGRVSVGSDFVQIGLAVGWPK